MPEYTRWTEELGATAGRMWPGPPNVRYDRDAWLRSLLYRDTSDGVGEPPCLLMVLPGTYEFLWPVDSGLRTLSVWCKHSGHAPRPRVVIKRNPEIGVMADIVTEASNILDWHQISVSVNPTALGVLEVHLEMLANDPNAWIRWDKIETT